MADMSHYAILYTFKPLNFSGEITVITRLKGNTYNYGVQRYRSLNPHHYHVLQTGANKQHAFILAQTDQSKIGIGLSSTIRGISLQMKILFVMFQIRLLNKPSPSTLNKIPPINLKNVLL